MIENDFRYQKISLCRIKSQYILKDIYLYILFFFLTFIYIYIIQYNKYKWQ